MGIGVGISQADPTITTEYESLQSSNRVLETDLARVGNNLKTLHAAIEAREAEAAKKVAGAASESKAAADRQAALTAMADEVKAAEAAVAAREAAVTGAEAALKATTITEGTWTVGVDIEPGTYRSAEAVGDRCYWAVLRSGTNGDDILSNDIPGGGRPTVTLRAGQDFETARCGDWVKQ